MYILGVSAFYHDSAAALIKDGEIIAAAQEERFTRKKHDPDFPTQAVKYCLEEARISVDHLTSIVFYEKPFLKFERLLETYLYTVPRGFNSFRLAVPLWTKEKLFQKSFLKKKLSVFTSCKMEDIDTKLLFAEHHQSHAASAFFPSPFEEAVVLTMDGVGEWATTSVGIGRDNTLTMMKGISYPHSLGLLYSAFTYYLGFKVNSGEYKVMGLAPYGEPKYVNKIYDYLIDVKSDGTFHVNQKYFSYSTDLTMINDNFVELFGREPRKPETPLSQFDMDMAASIQKVVEDVVLKLVEGLSRDYNIKNLCLAGGVALNCVANGKILKSGHFNDIWIQPAAGDAGGALGAALAAHYTHYKNKRVVSTKMDSMKGAYLGPKYSQDEIIRDLEGVGAKFHLENEATIIDLTANALKEGKAIGWFQGRMEFGPRALGARSIIADARSPKMQKLVNLKIKYRESFRPFAPSVLREDVKNWFDFDHDSPYMLLVANVNSDKCIPMTHDQEKLFGIDKLNIVRSEIPAVTHVDYSARIQTVHEETNPKYHTLIKRFKELTGCPVILNTSFNVRGEPLVCSPIDAFTCFMGTDLDVLVIDNCILYKEQQEKLLRKDYKDNFYLD